MDKNKDLFQFEWGADETFFIIKDGNKSVANPNDFEILEIGFLLRTIIKLAQFKLISYICNHKTKQV